MEHQILVSDDVIRPDAFSRGEIPQAHGGHIIFFGVVRKENLGRQVVAVAYDAFPALAQAELARISEEARQRWGESLCFRISHRTGRLNVGEISLAVSVSGKHRDEAYQASRYVIEQLKKRAPVWKKEFYEDGESAWLQGHALCGHDHAENAPTRSASGP